jgi:hypothetical protein
VVGHERRCRWWVAGRAGPSPVSGPAGLVESHCDHDTATAPALDLTSPAALLHRDHAAAASMIVTGTPGVAAVAIVVVGGAHRPQRRLPSNRQVTTLCPALSADSDFVQAAPVAKRSAGRKARDSCAFERWRVSARWLTAETSMSSSATRRLTAGDASSYLIDTSGIFRILQEKLRQAWSGQLTAGVIAICPVVELEFLFLAIIGGSIGEAAVAARPIRPGANGRTCLGARRGGSAITHRRRKASLSRPYRSAHCGGRRT